MNDDKTIVSTNVAISVEFPTIRESARDFGLDEDVTAQSIAKMLSEWTGSGVQLSTLSDWELLDRPSVYINVETVYSDGSRETSNEVVR